MLEFHIPFHGRQFQRLGTVDDFPRQIHDLEHAGRAGPGRGRKIDEKSQPLHGRVEHEREP